MAFLKFSQFSQLPWRKLRAYGLWLLVNCDGCFVVEGEWMLRSNLGERGRRPASYHRKQQKVPVHTACGAVRCRQHLRTHSKSTTTRQSVEVCFPSLPNSIVRLRFCLRDDVFAMFAKKNVRIPKTWSRNIMRELHGLREPTESNNWFGSSQNQDN